MRTQVNYIEDNNLYYRHLVCHRCNCSYDVIGLYKEIREYKRENGSWMTILDFNDDKWICPYCKNKLYNNYTISDMKPVSKKMMRALQRTGQVPRDPETK